MALFTSRSSVNSIVTLLVGQNTVSPGEIIPTWTPNRLNAAPVSTPCSTRAPSRVIGASDDASRIGGRPIHYMRLAGFEGAVYPVNPRYSEVQGIPAYPDIASVEGDIDLAIVAVPARIVPETIEACANRGVTSAVVFSAGFAETGAEGQAAQARITATAREQGIRVLGPNCLGLYNADIGFFGTFTTTFEDRFPAAWADRTRQPEWRVRQSSVASRCAAGSGCPLLGHHRQRIGYQRAGGHRLVRRLPRRVRHRGLLRGADEHLDTAARPRQGPSAWQTRHLHEGRHH